MFKKIRKEFKFYLYQNLCGLQYGSLKTQARFVFATKQTEYYDIHTHNLNINNFFLRKD